MDCVAHQASLSMGFPRQEYWCGLPFPSSGNLPSPGIEPASPALQADSLLSYQGSPKCRLHPWNSPGQNTEVGSLSLLQGIFPTQGLNPGLPHCRRILYQLSHQGPKNTGVGSLSLLQQIFLTQESNQSLLHGKRVLYQLSYQGSPNRYNIKVKYTLLTLDGSLRGTCSVRKMLCTELLEFLHKMKKPWGEPFSTLKLCSDTIKKLMHVLPFPPVFSVYSMLGQALYPLLVMCDPYLKKSSWSLFIQMFIRLFYKLVMQRRELKMALSCFQYSVHFLADLSGALAVLPSRTCTSLWCVKSHLC